MEKKCKKCGTTKDVNFDGLCQKCYNESIEIKENELQENQENSINMFTKVKTRIINATLLEKLATIIALILLITVFVLNSSSSSKVDLTNQVEQLTKQTEELKDQITDTNLKLEDSKKQLEEKSKEITTLQETNKALQDEKAKLEAEKQTLNQEIEQLKTSKVNSSTQSNSTTSTKSSTTKSTSSDVETASTSNSYTVYITDTGKKYHSAGCSYLKKSQHAISKSSAISQGYTACSRCNP